MKWIKRFFIFILVLVLGGLAFLATSYWLSRRNPTWYKPLALNSREMEAAAHRAFNKVVAIHNMADYAAATDTSKKWREEHGVTTLPAPPSMTASEREPWVVKRERKNTKGSESNQSVAQSSYAACTAPDAKKFEYSAGKRKWATARRFIESYSHCRAAVLFPGFGRVQVATGDRAAANADKVMSWKPLGDNNLMA